MASQRSSCDELVFEGKCKKCKVLASHGLLSQLPGRRVSHTEVNVTLVLPSPVSFTLAQGTGIPFLSLASEISSRSFYERAFSLVLNCRNTAYECLINRRRVWKQMPAVLAWNSPGCQPARQELIPEIIWN